MFEWIETTTLAQTIARSLMLTASLSAAHMLGFALVTGGAAFANLRLLGLLFAARPANEVTQPASRGIAIGLAVSVVTGALLLSGRASSLIASDTFQLKMLLLLLAAGFHFTCHRYVSGRASVPIVLWRLTGAIGLALWLGLAVSACVFILFD